MSDLNSKVQVLRGWSPGDASAVDPALPAASGLTFARGGCLVLNSSGELALPAPVQVAWQPFYYIAQGNTAPEYDTLFTGKLLALRGQLTVKTDRHTGAFTVGGAVTVDNAGRFIAAGANYRVGFVLADDSATDGTITVELTL